MTTAAGDGAAPCVLVADDDLMTRKVLSTVLDLEGYRVVTAVDGRQALEVLDEQPVHAAVLDHAMPELTGLEVIEQLRSSSTLADLPVVLLTAVVAPSFETDPLEAGADALISKPFSPLHLVDVLARLLGTRHG